MLGQSSVETTDLIHEDRPHHHIRYTRPSHPRCLPARTRKRQSRRVSAAPSHDHETLTQPWGDGGDVGLPLGHQLPWPARNRGILSIPSNRGDLVCSDVERVAGLVVPVSWVGRLDLPTFPCLRGRGGSGVQGAPKVRRAQRDAKHPGGLRGGPVSFAGSARPAAAQPPALSFDPVRVAGWCYAACWRAWASS
jgi:hypothetical protein